MQVRLRSAVPKGFTVKVFRTWAAALSAVSCVGCCAHRVDRADDLAQYAFLWAGPRNAPSTPRSEELLRAISERYARCHNYRDRGHVVTKHWMSGKSSISVFRFDTMFVRGGGFRFRFFDERGAMETAIWEHDGRVSAWQIDTEAEHQSLVSALTNAKGVTQFSSSIVSSLLVGAPLFSGDNAIALGAPSYVGIGSISCGKCSVIAIGPAGRRQVLLTVDEDSQALRHVEVLMVIGKGTMDAAEGFGVDEVISYDPEFDVADDVAMTRELEARPW